MKAVFTLFLLALGLSAAAQTTITNGGFESWGNTSPGIAAEPANWYSNQSGSSTAMLGPQTCFKDSASVHTGSYSVRVETVSGPLSTVINGNVTTGIVNAPTFTKTDGYIGTVNYSTPTDIRHMNFTGRPDSLVGWYIYSSGGAGEQGKVRAILHTGDYFDPETPATYHTNPTANKIADALFLTPMTSVAAWTRFSVPFTYVSSSSPAYIMINVTSSANQGTTVTGSKLWLDDLKAVYRSTGVSTVSPAAEGVQVYASGKTVYVSMQDGNGEQPVLSLYDLTGRAVLTGQAPDKQLSAFSLPDANTGIYLYQLSSKGFRKTGRVFIQ